MTRIQLISTSQAVRRIILGQAETRLNNQCAFVGAQEQRALSLVNTSAGLTAGSVGVAVGAASQAPPLTPLAIAAAVAAVGFMVAASFALWALRSRGFHAPGWYPEDFANDLDSGVEEASLEADFILDLQGRLSENRKVLDRNGQISNCATYALLVTPVAALITGLLLA